MFLWIVSVAIVSVVLFLALLKRPGLAPPFRAAESAAKVAIVLFFASIFLPAGYGAEILGTTSTGQMMALQTSPNFGGSGVLMAVGYILTPLSWIIVYSGWRPPHRFGYVVAAGAAWLSVVAAAYFISQHGIVIDRFLHQDRLLAFGSISWIAAAGLMAMVWTRELAPLWIWLTIAVLTTFLGTPADPISKLLALAYGLLCFWVGCILGSRTHIILRLLPLVLCVAIAAWLASLTVHNVVAISACYGLISIGIGMWVCRRIQYGRLRIVACFSVGYVIGSMVGPVGTILGAALGTSDTLWWVLRQCPLGAALGAVVGAVLARQSLPRPKLRESG